MKKESVSLCSDDIEVINAIINNDNDALVRYNPQKNTVDIIEQKQSIKKRVSAAERKEQNNL